FVNLSFISGIDFLANKKIPFFISHLFFFMLAMFTLETALGFIPVFMFYAFFVFRKECKTISRESLRMASSVSVAYAAVFILWFIVRRSAIGGGMPERDISVIINNIPAFFSSLVNFFIPFAARPLAKASYSIMPLLPGIAIVFVLAYLPFAGLVRNLRLYIIGLLFYLFFLMPSFMSGFEFNDMPHRIYVPSAGLLIMLSQVCWRRILPKKAIPAFCAAAVVFVSCCGVFFLLNYSNADIFWNRVLKDNPGNAAAYKQIININYEQGNYGQAAKTAYDFLEASGGDPDARVLYASNCGLADMPETAEENFRILLRDYPDRSDYRTAYAEFLALSGHDGAAENEHKKSLEYAPEYVYGHFSYANYLFSAGNLQGAENEYRNALRMSSKTSGRDWLNTFKYAKECSENLSYLLISKAAAEKDAKTAANILKEAAELNPSAMVYEKSADIMLANHLYREAASLYALAADSGEGNASRSAVGAGVAHVHSGDLKKAAYYFNLALEIDPGNRQAQLYRDELAVRIFNQPDK
ncbi:MAG: tetratricopeptide repeat protein, partial [Elusimicrobiales bacterium]|nr:tetratricopeptide repeat protein [Elusimicrobiales bacterium]